MFYIDDLFWTSLNYATSWVGLVSILTYLLVVLLQQLALHVPQNLKKKYAAEWALVTGASSGIGKAIAEKLAEQKINVVLVALDDPLLSSTFAELQQRYPKQSFRKVGVNLGEEGMRYMQPIVEATKDLHISLLFNNAGYINTGLFADTTIERLRANMECNAGCAVPITHHFLRQMLQRQQRGLVSFTSSASCYLPGPTATLYSPTKAFLTNFATTVAAEVRDAGVDVVVIHPSPVNTNFYKNQGPLLNSLKTAQSAAGSPMNIAEQIFAAAGRLTVWDQGVTCAAFRIVNKVIDFQLFSELVVRFAWLNGDHKRLVANSNTRGKKQS
ncbi:short-chain dehydrogenase, putative [Trypanosoma brucei gambiense DAL972]|uniref:Short-chain dehydrogenase, putative n=2 Tax=Trypanosoma brucei TaxID=5691 RepID=D0A534_TRYB9|nr:short-chain dehydrogenase, putative [Trypanosoma brucei gambiense DAL972]RHW68576.1 3-ketoacyl-CoA reductase [Trypanosoma brucei equiperdum]CBH16378.1 short-chain dehydrogenase, putative [Trypanosoma brucei gambiense DAL972]|eukprot:XP_011778642.1 short-chain dehydrogenase, putative [Trypanosoma brucei gambiense DAL972]